jgi:TM2 domain-containing membrane protein YozV
MQAPMTDVPAAADAQPGSLQASPKSYAKAVALSAVFGLVGVQHFYLGRHLEGLLDVGLTFGWIVCFAMGEITFALIFVLADVAHSFEVTIRLLTGNFRDGDGRVVCYPGQRLGIHRG